MHWATAYLEKRADLIDWSEFQKQASVDQASIEQLWATEYFEKKAIFGLWSSASSAPSANLRKLQQERLQRDAAKKAPMKQPSMSVRPSTPDEHDFPVSPDDAKVLARRAKNQVPPGTWTVKA